jgi:hypothetical protein
MKKTPEERFWDKVLIGDGCWEWQGAKFASGYGHFYSGGKVLYAHRVAYELHHGVHPGEMFVCHRCDHPGCVRPSHLFLGTNTDNMRDMAAKGRQWLQKTPWLGPDNSGDRNGRARLTARDIPYIREWARQGFSHEDIARAFNVTRSNVSFICRRDTWTKVPDRPWEAA